MMSFSKPCIICYKLVSASDLCDGQLDINIENDKDENKSKSPCELTEDKLTKFFHLLGRHLDDNPDKCGDNGESRMQFPFEQVIKSGVSTTCRDCSITVASFSDLYSQMKTIELMLNWKLWTLKNIMLCAHRLPTRRNTFRERIDQLDIEDVIVEDIMDWKIELVSKCERKLKETFPRLSLEKCPARVRVTEPALQIHQNVLSMEDDDSQAIVESPPSSSVFDDGYEPASSPLPENDVETSMEVETKHEILADKGHTIPMSNVSNKRGRPSGPWGPGRKGSQKCDLCSKMFTRRGLDMHYKTAHLKIRYNCEKCSKSFTQKGYLNMHVRNIHLGQTFKCRYCSKKFDTFPLRDKHIRDQHNSSPRRKSGIKKETEEHPSTETYISNDDKSQSASSQLSNEDTAVAERPLYGRSQSVYSLQIQNRDAVPPEVMEIGGVKLTGPSMALEVPSKIGYEHVETEPDTTVDTRTSIISIDDPFQQKGSSCKT